MNPYVIGGVVLVFGVMAWQLKASVTKNGELEAKLETQAQATQTCADANESSVAAIGTLRAEIERIASLRAAEAAERESLLVERDRELTAARNRAAELERERRNEIESNAMCAEVMAIHVDDACPASINQLRQRAFGESSHEDGGS